MTFLLKDNNTIKIKTLIFITKNYRLFLKSFEYVFASPKNIIFFLSIKQSKINLLKRFLFKKLQITLFNVSNFSLLYKKDSEYSFLNRFFLVLLEQVYFKIISFVLLHIFSFIPIKYRSQTFKNSIDTFFKNEKLLKQPFYAFQFFIPYQTFGLLTTFIKFLKKFIKDNFLINYIVFFILFQNKLFFKTAIMSFFFSQFDYFIFISLIKFTMNLHKTIKVRYKHIFYYVITAFQNIKKNASCQNFHQKKIIFDKQISNKTFFFNYFRNCNKGLIIFQQKQTIFFFLKKYFLEFSCLKIFFINYFRNINFFNFIGFNFQINPKLNKTSLISLLKNSKRINFVINRAIPMNLIKIVFINLGILNIKKKPCCNISLIQYYTKNIFYWYLKVYCRFIMYYKNCVNIKSFNFYLIFIFKWSLLLTFVNKHKKGLKYILKKYSFYLNTINKIYFKKFFLKTKSKINFELLNFKYVYDDYSSL